MTKRINIDEEKENDTWLRQHRKDKSNNSEDKKS